MSLGVVILTGGASRRMGADKASLDWLGSSAVERLLGLGQRLGAAEIVTAGPNNCCIQSVCEEPAGSGPVAGLLACAKVLEPRGVKTLLALAVDAPTLTESDLAPLLSSAPPGAAFEGLYLPLVVSITALPRSDGVGWSVRHLVEVTGLARPAITSTATRRLRGANTPQERASLLEDLRASDVDR